MAGAKSFTLVELLIVMIVISILAVSAAPLYSEILDRAYEAEILFTLSTLRTAQRAYRAVTGSYPQSIDDLTGGDMALLSSSDFVDMKYVDWEDFSVDGAGGSVWVDADGSLSGRYSHSTLTLSRRGGITRD